MNKIFRSYFPATRTFFLMIAFLVITFIAIFALLGHVRAIFFSHADTQNQSVVSLAANMANERINSKLIQLQALAYTPSSQKNFFNKKDLNRRLAQLIPEAAKIGYEFIQLTDSEGYSVSSNGNKVDIVEAGHFYRAIRGFTVISQISSENISGKPKRSGSRVVFLSVPVFSGAAVIGVLTAAIDIQKLSILQNINIPYSGAFLCLLDSNNNVVEYSSGYLREFYDLTRSSNFFSPLSSLIESSELQFLKQELSNLAVNMIKHHKSSKNDRIVSFASLENSDKWKLIAVSSEKSIRSQQNSILVKFGFLILLSTLLITLTAIYLYVMNWKYRRIRELSHRTIDKAGFHFFKISSNGEVMDFDENFASFMGVSSEKTVFSLKDHLDDVQTVFPVKSIDKESSFKLSVRNCLNEKTFLLIQVIGENERGFFPAFAIDVTKDELLQEKIRKLAYTDMTTNIPNRESFILKIESLNQNCLLKSFKSGLLFVNINNSHKILEIFGHRLFEIMIREVAERLSSAAYNAKASIYNLGTDDFVIVIDDYDQIDEIFLLAGEINKIFAGPFMLGDASFDVSCRIGIVSCTEYLKQAHITPSDVFRYGEIAVRLAKTNNNIFVLNMEHYLSVIHQLDMEMDLICSIKNKELKLNYQPIYSCLDNNIRSVEALIRWESKKHGKIPPAVFIPIAEKCGFINQLGDFVIDSSFDFALKLRSMGHNITVNFNVSSIQFLQSSFAEKLISKFKRSSLPKQSIGLEITESHFFNDMEGLRERLCLIRKAGINVSVDDFGTGYSSLSYLKDLPLDYLKIDRSFIGGIDSSYEQKIIFKGINDISRSLGIKVIAEGVETECQFNTVLECGCENIQGFFISRPMNEDYTLNFINTYTGFRK